MTRRVGRCGPVLPSPAPGPGAGETVTVPGATPSRPPRTAVTLEACGAALAALAVCAVAASPDRVRAALWALPLLGLPVAGAWVVARRLRREHPPGAVVVAQDADGLVILGSATRRRTAWIAGALVPLLLAGGLAVLPTAAPVGALALVLALVLAVVAHGRLYRLQPGRWTTPRLVLTLDALRADVPFADGGLPVAVPWSAMTPVDPTSARPVAALLAPVLSPARAGDARLVGPSLLGDEAAVAALVEHYRRHPADRPGLVDGTAAERLRAGRT